MANISAYLAAIMAAVYGQDVRSSIHDAIEIINDVSEVICTTGTAVTGPTSSSTGFYDDSLYLNTNTMELWKCVGTDSWSSQGVIKGTDGRSIVSVTKTATAGLVDTYTITYDSGSPDTFNVTNGANGTPGADGSVWYKGTALTGTGTGITGFPGNQNDFYLNSTDGYVYTCTATGTVSTATWDYVMTLTGGGGTSVTVVDNLTSTSSTDALSANQGRVLKGMVDSKADASSVPSVLDDLSDVDITTPSNNQVLKYDGTSSKWVNGTAPASGHTMLPDPTSTPAPTEADVVSAINTAITVDGGANDDVPSLLGVGKWSNTMTKTYTVTGSTHISESGIGTWPADPDNPSSAEKATWITIPILIGAGSNNNLDIKLTFDPTTVSVPITLGGYVIDDSDGTMCVKFGNEIPSADTATAKVGIEVIIRRTETTAVS